MAEVSIISQLRHRNVVKLLGWCLDRDKFLLVYELMPNGSLDRTLFYPAKGSVLSWELRFKIILGAAESLHYLHKGWRQQVLHRDFKSSNILLDEEFNGMLGDFGLARKVDHHQDAATTTVAGTYVYVAPEVPATQKFTEKTDVYAFGAVTLEIVTGCRALNFDPAHPGLLVESVWSKVVEVVFRCTSVNCSMDRRCISGCGVDAKFKLGSCCYCYFRFPLEYPANGCERLRCVHMGSDLGRGNSAIAGGEVEKRARRRKSPIRECKGKIYIFSRCPWGLGVFLLDGFALPRCAWPQRRSKQEKLCH
ncbi:hypothetical protein Mapa_004897 [Marchantia paleacea]|nr:hypothetical protein Mapa_004897 [Marchantia paleacea]